VAGAMSAWIWIAVALLGGVGACARFLLISLIATRHSGNLPLGVFAVNISGSLLLGLVAGLALSGEALVLTGTATLGSYTTFSTWMLETQRLGEHGRVRAAALNVVVSIVLGVAAVVLGRTVGAQL
jgi:fluoride exporter